MTGVGGQAGAGEGASAAAAAAPPAASPPPPNVQLTVLKISGYGPWTLELGSDREHRLQMLQASLYRSVQEQFSAAGCLAFHNRADEFFVVSNRLGLDGHLGILRAIEARSPEIRLAASVGVDTDPFGANLAAHRARVGGLRLSEDPLVFGEEGGVGAGGSAVTILHMDVENLTGAAESASPYEVSASMASLHSRMAEFFVANRALAFFMGGDNFMVVCGAGPGPRGAPPAALAEEFLAAARGGGTVLNCGVGTGRTGREAARLATGSLDEIRRIRDSGGDPPRVYERPCS